MKNLIKITFCLLIASFALTSCGGDDEPEAGARRLVSFKSEYGRSLEGFVYVFPYATNYDPSTFGKINSNLTSGKIVANIATTDGKEVESVNMMIMPCDWSNIDAGKYYLIGYSFEYVTGWGIPYISSYWKYKVVDIAKNSTGEITFTFSSTQGYQGED